MGPFLLPPSPAPPTKLKPCLLPILRLLFVFFLPATLSTLALQEGSAVESLAWLKYWNVLSFALILELLLDKLLVNKKSLALPFNLIKVFTIVWLVAPGSYNGSELCHDYVIGPLVELTKEGCIDTALWAEATAPVVWDAVLEFGEQTGLTIYHFGELSLEVTCVYGGIALEAICYASTVALEYGQILLEVSFDAASDIAVIMVDWMKDGFSSETIDGAIRMVQETLENLLKDGHSMLKASFSNGEEYRILSSTLNNIVGVNYNPRLFSDLVKTP